MDGAQYQASRREMRNIVLKIRILSIPGEANVQELRKQLYEYLLPKSNVKIRFTQDYISTFSIEGQVESFDAPIFVKEPEATISILCFDPDFYKEVTTSFSGVSVISGSTSYSNLNYTGSVDTGFIFTITANDSTNSFTLESTSSDNVLRKMTFTDNTGLLASGDKIIVSTVPGDKYVKRVRSNVETSILWALDRTSDWIRLYPGYNEVAVKTAVTINHPYTIVYTDKVGGL